MRWKTRSPILMSLFAQVGHGFKFPRDARRQRGRRRAWCGSRLARQPFPDPAAFQCKGRLRRRKWRSGPGVGAVIIFRPEIKLVLPACPSPWNRPAVGFQRGACLRNIKRIHPGDAVMIGDDERRFAVGGELFPRSFDQSRRPRSTRATRRDGSFSPGNGWPASRAMRLLWHMMAIAKMPSASPC